MPSRESPRTASVLVYGGQRLADIKTIPTGHRKLGQMLSPEVIRGSFRDRRGRLMATRSSYLELPCDFFDFLSDRLSSRQKKVDFPFGFTMFFQSVAFG